MNKTELFESVVTKALKKGNGVQWIGFGTCLVAKQAARTGCNPTTSKRIKIACPRDFIFTFLKNWSFLKKHYK